MDMSLNLSVPYVLSVGQYLLPRTVRAKRNETVHRNAQEIICQPPPTAWPLREFQLVIQPNGQARKAEPLSELQPSAGDPLFSRLR